MTITTAATALRSHAAAPRPQHRRRPVAPGAGAPHRTARAAVQRYRSAERAERAERPQAAYVYRRRRLVVAAVVLIVVSSLVMLAGHVGQADADLDGPAPASPVYVVQPGDTLWSIAQQLAPGSDPRELVGQLTEATGSADLVPGQRIELPRRLG